MKKITLLIFTGLFLMFNACIKPKLEYPETKKEQVVDEYFGIKVSDPYRWLENDNSPETKAWVEAQNEVTFNYLDGIEYRDNLKKRLTELWNFEKSSAPFKAGDYYFIFKNDGLQNQSVLYKMDNLDSEPELFLDPNKLSEDGTVALTGFKVSSDGKYFAYSISRSGSDWNEIFVMDIESKELLNDHLKWIKFSGISWYKNGFYYSRFDAPGEGDELSQMNKNHKVYYHKLGTSQDKDNVVFCDPEHPLRNYRAQVSEDEKYLFIYESESTNGNNLFIKNLKRNEEFVQLTTNFKYDYRVIGTVEDNVYLLTNHKAPKYKLVKVDVNKFDIGDWYEILPERKEVLSDCELVGEAVMAKYIVDANDKLELYNLEGKLLDEIELPAIGSVQQMEGSLSENIAFYSFNSFAYPPTIFQYNLEGNTSSVYFEPEVNFNPENYTTEQVFYESKDGTTIPMFISYRKDIDLDAKVPTMLYAYGGFNVSMKPVFSASNLGWMNAGGIYAMACIRGGGEYGENWHRAGMQLNKQNVFDDFISAAEYLIHEGYTSSDKLAIRGGSNGGTLIGAVTNQRPELFAVAFPQVGVMDMLRFHKFTIGWAWVNEYGSSEDSIHFENLYNYSPIHNIDAEKDYPAVMVTTADHDDRVVPAHSFKYIATLQEKYEGRNPVVIRIETKAGHGAGKPVDLRIQETADIISFALYNMREEPNY